MQWQINGLEILPDKRFSPIMYRTYDDWRHAVIGFYSHQKSFSCPQKRYQSCSLLSRKRKFIFLTFYMSSDTAIYVHDQVKLIFTMSHYGLFSYDHEILLLFVLFMSCMTMSLKICIKRTSHIIELMFMMYAASIVYAAYITLEYAYLWKLFSTVL